MYSCNDQVAFTAFQQRREALSICNAIRQLQGHAPIETTVQKILRLLPRKYPKTPCIEANHEMVRILLHLPMSSYH